MGLNLNTAMDSIGTALGGISGLNVYPYIPDQVTPPAAVVGFPEEVEYDHTMARGKDRALFEVTVLVQKTNDQTARADLAGYMNGAGTATDSVKSALDAIGSHVRVARARVGVTNVGELQYLSCSFDVDWVQ